MRWSVLRPKQLFERFRVVSNLLPYQFMVELRIYFGKDGELLVILLGGGTKKRQRRDIAAA